MHSQLPTQILNRYDVAIHYEWLETNGLGGFASSTVIGTHTRRYHGLLVAADPDLGARRLMLSRLDETIEFPDGNTQGLATIKYPGKLSSGAYIFQQGFSRGLFPQFRYELNAVILQKTICCLQGENTTLILYELLEAPDRIRMALSPFYSPRDMHCLSIANDQLSREFSFSDGHFSTTPYAGLPSLHIAVPHSRFESAPDWYYQMEYAEELRRGLEGHEDMFTPGRFVVEMKKGDRLGIIISTEETKGRDAWQLYEQEAERRRALLPDADTPRVEGRMLNRLLLASDQFVVSRKSEHTGIVAGYPWFGEWGRDSMIAIHGLLLATDRLVEAGDLLLNYARHLHGGLIPNYLREDGRSPAYHTVDASLWFVLAVAAYLRAGGAREQVFDQLLPTVLLIIKAYREGTAFGIRMDSDGLIVASPPDLALTWMDAVLDGDPVTPRRGKAVEINALWYNSLRTAAWLCRVGKKKKRSKELLLLAEKVQHSFEELFWNEERQHLNDFIDGDYIDTSLRPNQIFSISLQYPLLEGERAERVLAAIESDLLTPTGLRSLSPDDGAYRPSCKGDKSSRDRAYHQGTVWPWLIGPYVDALVRLRGLLGQEMARKIVLEFNQQFDRACLGSVSEIFDGQPPHEARGCIAQAWSVSELLRLTVRYKLLEPSAIRML